MIVAAVNLLVYLLIDGDFTKSAERVFARDRRWIAPRYHRAELLNVLATNVREGVIPEEMFEKLWRKAFRLVATPTEVEPIETLRLAVASRISTYDCEYVALARLRRLKLVTNDKKVLEVFSDVAVSIDDFAEGK